MVTSIPWLPGVSPQQCFQEALAEAELAEALGFDSVWFTEHHFAVHGLCSGITPLLAAVAQRTKRIRLGAAVHVLPFWNPVRLAEDLAVVDILSNGRLEFGVGTGYRLEEFRGFGVSPEQAKLMGRECLDAVLALWSGKPVTFEGQTVKLKNVAACPPPLQQPHPPVWHAGNSPASLEFIAERRYNWMAAATFGPFSAIAEHRRYLDGALARRGVPQSEIRVYAHVPTYISNGGYEEIRREMEQGVQWFFNKARWFSGGESHAGGTIYDAGRPAAAPGADYIDFPTFFDNNCFYGDADVCTAKIERFCRQVRPTDLICLFKLGQPHGKVTKAMEQFARDVMPRIRGFDFAPAVATQ